MIDITWRHTNEGILRDLHQFLSARDASLMLLGGQMLCEVGRLYRCGTELPEIGICASHQIFTYVDAPLFLLFGFSFAPYGIIHR